MRKHTEIKELLKTALIVLLLVSALAMGASLNSLRVIISPEEDGVKTQPPTAENGFVSAELPSAISVMYASGERKSAKYGSTDKMYSLVLPAMREAASTATGRKDVTENAYRTALLSSGIYCEYRFPVSLSVLAKWLGVTEGYAVDIQVSALCIKENELYISSPDGHFYRFKTALPETVSALDTGAGDSGAVFAFEYPELSGVCGNMLLFPEVTSHSTFTSSNPMSSAQNRELLLTFLDAAMSINNTYTGSDGSVVYVASDFTLKISPDGTAVYKLTGIPANAPRADSISQMIEEARRVCSLCISPFSGDASLQYSESTFSDAGGTVCFDYIIDGGKADTGSHAAEFDFSDGVMTEIRIVFLKLLRSAEMRELMPEHLAAAAVGKFELIYIRSENSFLPVWTAEAK